MLSCPLRCPLCVYLLGHLLCTKFHDSERHGSGVFPSPTRGLAQGVISKFAWSSAINMRAFGAHTSYAFTIRQYLELGLS